MPLDPTISLQGVYTNPNAMVQQSGIALQRQQMQQAQQMQPYKIQQMQAEAAGTQADTQKKQLDTTIAKANRIGDLLGSVDSSRPAGDPVAQGQWNSAIQQAKSEGFDVSKFEGTPYDPNKVNQVRQQTMGVLNSATLQSKQLIMRANFQRQLLNTVGDTDKVQQIMSLWDMNNAPAYGGITQQSPAQAPASNNGLTGPAALPATPPATSTAGQPMPSTAAVTGAMNATPNAAIPPANAAPANAPPALPPPQGPAQTGQPMSSLPAQQASAMPVAATQQPTAAQIAQTPINQSPIPTRPNVTTLRNEQQKITKAGGVIGINQAKILQQHPEMDPTTAFLIAKNGLKVGQTIDPTGKVINMDGSVDAQATQAYQVEASKQKAEVDAAEPKAENAAQGKVLGDDLKTINDQADAASQQKNLVSQLRTDSESWTTGKGAYSIGQGRMFLKAVGLDTPEMDSQISDQQSFEKVAGQVLRQQVKDTSSRAAVQEFNLISKTLPNDGTDHGALMNITAQLLGSTDYTVAKQTAMQSYMNIHGGSLKGFDAVFNQNVTPAAFSLPYLSAPQREQLFSNLAKEPGGMNILKNIQKGYVYAKNNGLLEQ